MMRHILVNFFLQIYSRGSKCSNDDIRADSAANWHVTVWVCELSVRGIVFDGLSALLDGRIYQRLDQRTV